MIEQCEKCARYNSLGCPYSGVGSADPESCDEYIPNEETKITDPIKKQLFNLLRDSPSLDVMYEEQWAESVEYLVSNGVTIRNVAEWIFSGYSLKGERVYKCSNCGYLVANLDDVEMRFCPGCGDKTKG